MRDRRIGAYVLPGDIVWLERTLKSYYHLLDDLVIPVPDGGIGWNGVAVPVQDALARIRKVDHRGIARSISGEWVNPDHPMRADTAQRQAALDDLRGRVDWVIQLDNDEYLPDPEALLAAVDEAERRNLPAVEWPMRVLFRRTRKWVFEIVAENGQPHYEYPGPVVVRPEVRLTDARRTEGEFLRAVVGGDTTSLEVRRPAEEREHRWQTVTHQQAIIHNSWARTPKQIRAKLSSWGHAGDFGRKRYYWTRWWPTPLIWRIQRDFHPFSSGLWPRLFRLELDAEHPD